MQNRRPSYWCCLIYVGGCIICVELICAFYRDYRRKSMYEQALTRAKMTNKPLLVIGSPSNGFWSSTIHIAYGCGDVCLDLLDCTPCMNSIQGDVLDKLRNMQTNQYVIFESCVLEYVTNNTHRHMAQQEIERVSGGDTFQVRIQPILVPMSLYKNKLVELG